MERTYSLHNISWWFPEGECKPAAMFCEGRLHIMTFGEMDTLDSLSSQKSFQIPYGPATEESPLISSSRRPTSLAHQSSFQRSSSEELYISPSQSLKDHGDHQPGRQMSPEIDIPHGDTDFLVPSFCESICKNYSDLHIGGDQVLPLFAHNAELQVCANPEAIGPFLQSGDVLPAVESLQGAPSQGGALVRQRGASSRWWLGGGRDRSFLFQGCERPFSNSLLNHYLETKVLDLYQQYMMENMEREGSAGSNSPAIGISPLLGSELVVTSLDQITLQLSREGNLEAGLAKDMVLSCLLRVAGDTHSCEISTPVLQISDH
ncbi:uncharacterized protein CXorf21 [Gouania willdenowi]|uniref:Uncharacterized protein n=1 Tax=Gouania willdenowi TaxID=441366 RepID=A0A8C5GFH5_GOUWI|nr:uncharacterized protein CXorf21 homolog [Gouania willdenowi]